MSGLLLLLLLAGSSNIVESFHRLIFSTIGSLTTNDLESVDGPRVGPHGSGQCYPLDHHPDWLAIHAHPHGTLGSYGLLYQETRAVRVTLHQDVDHKRRLAVCHSVCHNW